MYCAHCGEWNTSGSRTCSQCGQALATAPGKGTPGGRACPMCMTVNAPGADFCTACGARVVLQGGLDEADLDILRPPAEPPVPLSAAAQLALNLERQREVLAGRDDSPPDATLQRLAGDPPEQRSRSLFGGAAPAGGGMSWLDSLRDDSPPAATAPESEPDLDWRGDPAPSAAPADSGMPDWLAQLRGGMHTPAANAAETPPPPAAPAATPVPSAADALPAWMSGPADLPAPPVPPAAEMLPEWLRFAAAPDAGAQVAPPPAALTEEGAASVPVPSEPSGLPAWMDSTSAPAAPTPPADAPSGLPLWMDSDPASTIQASERRTQNPADPSGLPAWMDSTPAVPVAPAPNEPSGLPAWMDSAPAVPVAPALNEPSGLPAWMDSAPAVPVAPAPNEPSGLPAWMDSAPILPTVPASSEPSGLPAWMDSTSAPAAPTPPADEPSGLPLWMDSDPAPAIQNSELRTQNSADPSGLPAWMDSAPAASTPSEPSGLPSWMDSGPTPATQNSELRTPNSDVGGLGDIVLPAWLQAAGAGALPPAAPPPARKPLTGKLLALDDEDEDEAGPPPPTVAEGVLPAWMSGPISTPAEQTTPATPAADLPAWMSGPAPVPSTPSADSTGAADLPAWMSGPAPVPSTPSADSTGAADLPAWMSGPAPVPSTPSADSTGAADLPPAPVPSTPSADSVGADDLPAWMSGPAPVPSTPSAADPDPLPTNATQDAELSAQHPVVDGFPSWMSGPAGEGEADRPADAAQSATRNPQPADDGFLSESDLPAWLRAVQARDQAAAAPVPEAPPAPQPVEAAADELPAWLRALGGSEDEIDQAAATLTAGPTPPSMVRVIRARPPRAGAVQVFEQLLAAPVEAAPVVAPTRNAMMAAFTPERIFAVVLLAVIGLFVGLTPLPSDTINAPTTAAGQAFYSTLKALPATKPVLLVYDWDASRYGEMYELSRAVTGAVVGSGHRFATISTVPEGTGFALNVTASVFPTATTSINCGVSLGSGAYGTSYLHLGYRPGNEAGLADLINGNISDAQRYDAVCYHEVTNTPLLATAPSLRDFGAVVLLAGDERPMRMWIEQVGSRLAGATPAVPLLAAMPEGGRPAALPYTGGNGALLRSAIYGLAGAQEIESLTSGGNAAPNPALGARLHTESAALLTLAAALVLAFIGGAFRWINRRSSP